MTTAPRTVSILGLGLMGSALAEALLSAGHTVTVWNRTAAKSGPLIAKGARAAESAAEAIAASDVTIVCMINHAASMEVLGSVPTGAPDSGGCLVQLTTLTPADSYETAAWAHGHGLSYLEGSIIGVPRNVIGGSATIVAAGSREVFDAIGAVLQPFGGGKHISEEIGAAVSFDRVYYAYSYGGLFAFMHGAALAHAMGFSIEAFTEIVQARMEAVTAGFREVGANIAARDHRLRQCRADVWAEGMAGTLTLCRETGVDDTLPAAIMQLFERNRAAGRGGEELSSVFETLIEGGRSTGDAATPCRAPSGRR